MAAKVNVWYVDKTLLSPETREFELGKDFYANKIPRTGEVFGNEIDAWDCIELRLRDELECLSKQLSECLEKQASIMKRISNNGGELVHVRSVRKHR